MVTSLKFSIQAKIQIANEVVYSFIYHGFSGPFHVVWGTACFHQTHLGIHFICNLIFSILCLCVAFCVQNICPNTHHTFPGAQESAHTGSSEDCCSRSTELDEKLNCFLTTNRAQVKQANQIFLSGVFDDSQKKASLDQKRDTLSTILSRKYVKIKLTWSCFPLEKIRSYLFSRIISALTVLRLEYTSCRYSVYLQSTRSVSGRYSLLPRPACCCCCCCCWRKNPSTRRFLCQMKNTALSLENNIRWNKEQWQETSGTNVQSVNASGCGQSISCNGQCAGPCSVSCLVSGFHLFSVILVSFFRLSSWSSVRR